MEELQKIKVKKSNGEEIEAEIIICFQIEKTGKNYMIYTFNEVDAQNMETIHASVIKETENGYQLDSMSEEEWSIVKEVMREMIRNEAK